MLCARQLRALPAPVVRYLVNYFEVGEPRLDPRALDLHAALAPRGLLTVDLVLALLRSPDRACLRAAEELAGVKLQRIPAIKVRPLPRLPKRRPRGPDDERQVTARSPKNPHSPNTKSHSWFELARPRRSIIDLLARGVPRRYLNEAMAQGWVRFSP